MSKLFNIIIARKNLYLSAHRAAAEKRFKGNIAAWHTDEEFHINALHNELKDGLYLPGTYRIFTIYEPKKREICVAPFKDRVVHHAVHDIIMPEMDKRFIFDSYACRPGKGTHAALNRTQKFLRAKKYCFHGDIQKYFHSINHQKLKNLLRRHITDIKTLHLLDLIIDSPKSDHGLPIGNLTSQFFANLYLHELDLYVKHALRVKHYLRYMDDFLLFDNNRERLIEARKKIRCFLKQTLGLTLHPHKSQIHRTSGGVKFLGFRLFVNCRRLSTNNVKNFRKKIKKMKNALAKEKISFHQLNTSLCAWMRHAEHGSTTTLRKNMITETLEFKKLTSPTQISTCSVKKRTNPPNPKNS